MYVLQNIFSFRENEKHERPNQASLSKIAASVEALTVGLVSKRSRLVASSTFGYLPSII
jgi:hypothetical protein